jgi:hypothetical protein
VRPTFNRADTADNGPAHGAKDGISNGKIISTIVILVAALTPVATARASTTAKTKAQAFKDARRLSTQARRSVGHPWRRRRRLLLPPQLGGSTSQTYKTHRASL